MIRINLFVKSPNTLVIHYVFEYWLETWYKQGVSNDQTNISKNLFIITYYVFLKKENQTFLSSIYKNKQIYYKIY